MNFLNRVARIVHAYECGRISAEEFVGTLMMHFAYDEDLDPKEASEVAALIPPTLRATMREQIDDALSPEYLRRFVCSGRWTEEERRPNDLAVTARERAWAEALKLFFP